MLTKDLTIAVSFRLPSSFLSPFYHHIIRSLSHRCRAIVIGVYFPSVQFCARAHTQNAGWIIKCILGASLKLFSTRLKNRIQTQITFAYATQPKQNKSILFTFLTNIQIVQCPPVFKPHWCCFNIHKLWCSLRCSLQNVVVSHKIVVAINCISYEMVTGSWEKRFGKIGIKLAERGKKEEIMLHIKQ